MKEKINDRNRIQHIADACRILIDRSKHDTLESLTKDPIKFYGYVKLIEIIGEATFKLTKEYRTEHTDIPWRMIEGMRHVLVHDYYMISPTKLWNTVETDIPVLYSRIKELLTETNNPQ